MADTFDYFKRKSSTSGTQSSPFNQRQPSQTQPPQTAQPPAPTAPQAPTFSMLQSWGMARPAPPSINTQPTAQAPSQWDQNPARTMSAPAPQAPPNTGGFTPAPTGGMPPQNQNLNFNLLSMLGHTAQNPSRYTGDVVEDAYNRLDTRMADQFNVERQMINEDAARRGLYYGTIPVGRLGDVGIRQSQARSDLASNLLQDQARTYGDDRSRAIADLMGYGQQQFSNQLDTARFNADQDLANAYLMLQLLGYT